MSANAERLRDPNQRAERATRILDTAADLLLRHGYRRVTIDDVAAGAGIGKGTVYLHWKTREQLFGAVFDREVLTALDELRQALEKDPDAALLHRFAQIYFLAITRRPLLRGFLLTDPELLGKLAATRDSGHDDRHSKMSREYFELLGHHELLRDDLNLEQLGYAYQATFEGFLRAETSTPEGGAADHAELLAQTVRRAFESDRKLGVIKREELAAGLTELLTDLIAADRAEAGIPAD
ncbi:TetR/AcrR family transcriptional regulator [Kribbella qitaiheensis]|uniref:TetR/AcrR family transcriptional regulator n=1 Tax=Kribbella qitaiheensis TaxID=1544730 RepID=A0A7G6X2X5_9ACTN|nr:TetR/AcrR family transcriptional regulator [Kribbella qitaiheensis]QNE20590.1 TetR/AcrR family transcriptional regulator [Kribbella qitaiheensis]